jgi:pantoate--beta-alanine ligase
MQVIHTLSALRAHLARFQHPALVPTMGNLHEGHLALVRQAKPLGDVTVASIFVNRLQFAPHEDFATYPRTLQADCEKLEAAGCDVVFAPSEAEFYPVAQTFKVQPPAELADMLEGHFRPGFFTGVCTVVLKLFNCVFSETQGSRVALFGQKDYQQQLIIRHMVAQMALPIAIHIGPTQRASDGLALSSRNGYLSEQERTQAVQLSQTLKEMVAAVKNRQESLAGIEIQAMQKLQDLGWQPDYMTVRNQGDLKPPAEQDLATCPLVVLGAARLGRTRLIDNLEI